MKKKSVITIVSVALNLALFSTLAYFDKVNAHAEGMPALHFVVKHLDGSPVLQGERHEIALASTVK